MKTTRETARQESHKKVANSLQELLEKNYDAEKDYRSVQKRAENVSLKDFFKKQAVRKNHYATEIDRQLHAINERPREKGTALGSLNRTWINFKSSMGNSDKVLLEECLRGEMNSVDEYESKMSKIKFPATIEEMLQRQLTEMRSTLNEVKSIEDLH